MSYLKKIDKHHWICGWKDSLIQWLIAKILAVQVRTLTVGHPVVHCTLGLVSRSRGFEHALQSEEENPLQKCTGGRAIFASGSPFPPVKVGDSVVASSQCNNRRVRNQFVYWNDLSHSWLVISEKVSRQDSHREIGWLHRKEAPFSSKSTVWLLSLRFLLAKFHPLQPWNTC